MNSNHTLQELQAVVDEWITAYGVRYFSPLTNFAILAEEVGEVGRLMARLYGDQSTKAGENISTQQLADELADTLWVLLAIANQTGCNLTQAFQQNLQKKSLRDAHRHKNNPKLY